MAVQIGAGMQAAVFDFEEAGNFSGAMKEYRDNANLATNLQHEYSLHVSVRHAFDRYERIVKSGVRVPRVRGHVSAGDVVYWKHNLARFPAAKALSGHFYPRDDVDVPLDPESVVKILDDSPSKHCLARTYLGRENGHFTREDFSLRNFPLYLKPIEELGLDVKALASAMGKAFAIMHWGAGVDGDDVEFVLGSSVARPAFKGAIVTGDNQLFIPHYGKSPELYAAFKDGYMDAGQAILKIWGMESKFNMEDFMKEYEEYAEDFLG
ncbi:hypothetical protein GE09DRAFT_1281098 [Coniochaeta sp. 2T2.1]|nr:hypothetical protein GE09DRAFT_1281098 [Coniochaeta sp. 2T2.1]